MNLTEKQTATLKFIKRYFWQFGLAPTEAEIATGIGIKSRGVVHRYLKALQEAEMITLIPNKRRNIKLRGNAEDFSPLELPLIGKIAAGQPIEAIANDEVLNIADHFIKSNRFVLQVKGDSMIGDNICDGDYIVCESCNDAQSDWIVVVLIDQQEATLKRFRKNSDNTITLIPSNPRLSPQVYNSERIKIQGRYIGLLRFQR